MPVGAPTGDRPRLPPNSWPRNGRFACSPIGAIDPFADLKGKADDEGAEQPRQSTAVRDAHSCYRKTSTASEIS